MEVVINGSYGDFCLSKGFAEKYGFDMFIEPNEDRADPRLINAIKEVGGVHNAEHHSLAHLAIVNVPDTATDYEIIEYDGKESIIFVENGKLYHLYADGEIE